MQSLVLCTEGTCTLDITDNILDKYHVELIRFDLAWELFLGQSGRNETGELDIPAGNPRTKWFGLHQWLRSTLGLHVDILHTEPKRLLAVLPPSSLAAYEYVTRTLSMYSTSLGVLHTGKMNGRDIQCAITCFYEQGSHAVVTDGWVPPVINLHEKPTPLLTKTSKVQDGSTFTWLGGVLGSDRLFAQVYHLTSESGANRLHSHSHVDEMFVILDGEGTLITESGSSPVKKGDLIAKPAGSGLSTRLLPGPSGMQVLDIEVWAHSEQADVVSYPQHGELFVRGRSLHHVTALDNLLSADDMMKRYTQLYRRNRDGTVTSD
ncbi:putative cupin superfamily protein [Aneurinibacillus soli]|uniref:Cupin domain protein n=2 Tax=Aneurinibacillus soli TaxID=1500254 RepID=A0A0U5AQZ7_9BACL|nr:putative cupin superfamily protein [Aneurinibacillus soli]BAU26234.1 Cupin domain protein [Aneurinibacillus soli]